MTLRNLFQFNASPRTPKTLQRTAMDVIELCNRRFRSTYSTVAQLVCEEAARANCDHVVELGAGNAPVTTELLRCSQADSLRMTVCDLIPPKEHYQRLCEANGDRVTTILKPVDFSDPQRWEPRSLGVLVASFHHISESNRDAAFNTLARSVDRVVLYSPVRRTGISMFFAIGIVVPAVLAPWMTLDRPGRLRRFLWCNLIPLVVLMMLWDGVSGCLKQRSAKDWRKMAERTELPRPVHIEERLNSQVVIC